MLCEPPDPIVIINVNGAELGRTSVVTDNGFELPVLALIAGSRTEFQVFDEDIADDDVAFIASADPIAPDLLRGRIASGGEENVSE